MFKKIFIVLIIFAALSVMAFTLPAATKVAEKTTEKSMEEGYSPIVVLELFTSQGCSSCPSADALLEKVKKEHSEGVFTLSYHVDYWNYIGWKDPFSKSEYTQIQRAYNTKLRYNGNYTPEVVVNGKAHFVGSDASKMNIALDAFGKERVENAIEISNVKRDNGKVTYDYQIKGAINNKNLRAVLVVDERITSVKRGENRNRTIKNSNIVVAETKTYIKMPSATGSIEIPKLVRSKDQLHLILLVENVAKDLTAATKKSLN